jgi:very-short-patch-repair endonuclease
VTEVDNEPQLRAIQGRQLGLITRDQVLAVASRRVIEHRLGAAHWRQVLPGVYADSLASRSLWQSSLAALLWAGDDSMVSCSAAGALFGYDGVSADRVHIWTPRSPKSELVVVHRGVVDATDRRMLGPIALTSPARTIMNAAVEDAIHRGLTTPTSIGRRLDALGGKGRPGSGRLRSILDDRGNQPAAASRLEVKIWRTLRARGLRPARQHRVRCGTATYYLDCAFPQWRTAVEGFGDKYHRAVRNRKRELKRLADLAGVDWRVIPVTWEDITDAPDEVVARIMRRVAA